MFKKLRALFTLEDRMDAAVSAHLARIDAAIKNLSETDNKNVVLESRTISRIKGEMGERMSKIEVLFEDEIKAKEAARNDKVRKAQAKVLGNG